MIKIAQTILENIKKNKIQLPLIKEFQGRNRFLSNFWREPLHQEKQEDKKKQVIATYYIEGYWWDCTERYYQARKFFNSQEVKQEIINASRIGQTKSIAHKNKKLMRPIFQDPTTIDRAKLMIMGFAINAKFNCLPLKIQLLLTLNAPLQEGNRWNDTFFGVNLTTRQGENHLGKIIMEKREKLLNDPANNIIHCPRCNELLFDERNYISKLSFPKNPLRIMNKERERITSQMRKHLYKCYTNEEVFGFKLKEIIK